VLLDADLALAGRRHLDVLEGQNLRAAVFVDAHCRYHSDFPF
jgi:hypothetical protein